MRTKLLKTMMPFAVLMFAVVAAFATQAKEVSSSTLVDAYYQPVIFGEPCMEASTECTINTNNPICKDIGGVQVYGLQNPNDASSCTLTLNRP